MEPNSTNLEASSTFFETASNSDCSEHFWGFEKKLEMLGRPSKLECDVKAKNSSHHTTTPVVNDLEESRVSKESKDAKNSHRIASEVLNLYTREPCRQFQTLTQIKNPMTTNPFNFFKSDTESERSCGCESTKQVQSLTKKLLEMELTCRTLKDERDIIRQELSTERNKMDKLEDKIKFIRDNQCMFRKMKENYLDVVCKSRPYLNHCGKSLTNVPNMENMSQKFETTNFLHKSYVLSQSLEYGNAEDFSINSEKSLTITMSQFQNLKDTVLNLKTIINKREESNTQNMDKLVKSQLRIAELEKDNKYLKTLLSNKQIKMEIDVHKKHKTDKSDASKDVHRELSILKRIVVKLGNQYKVEHGEISIKTVLSDTEQNIVDYLSARYEDKVAKASIKRRAISCDRTPSKLDVLRLPKSSPRKQAFSTTNLAKTKSKCLEGENVVLMKLLNYVNTKKD